MMRTVTVLGAGTMGAQIAAHCANAGFDVQVLDVSRRCRPRRHEARRRAASPIRSSRRARPGRPHRRLRRRARRRLRRRLGDRSGGRAPRRQAGAVRARRRRPGAAHDRHLEHLGHPDRRARRGPQRRLPPPLSRHALLQPAALPEAARADPDTGHGSRRRRARSREVGDRRLGKGVVVAKDTPNFIANHIGLYAIARILDVSAEGSFTIEEIDAMTGPAIGRPKSATFRTLDITGLDVLVHVARNLESRVGAEQARGLRSAAAGAGRSPSAAGSARRPARASTSARRARRPVGDPDARSGDDDVSPAADRRASPRSTPARAIEDAGARMRALFLGEDKVGDFLRRTLGADAALHGARSRPTSRTASTTSIARCAGASAGSSGRSRSPTRSALRDVLDAVRRAPGLRRCRRWSPSGWPPARDTFRDGRACRPPAGVLRSGDAKARTPVVADNPGASLVDLGDGVLAARAALEDERAGRRRDRDAAGGVRRPPRRSSRRWSSATTPRISPPAPT